MSVSKHPSINPTRAITAVAAATALALVLGYLKLYRLPQGGSITLETAVPDWVSSAVA
jgi:thiamine transporter ThiT